MRVTAALAWYDEPVHWLTRLVHSLAGLADELVAVDGRWQLFADDAPVSSPIEQRLAVLGAANDVGINAVVLQSPGRPWRSQVEKRDEMMRVAGAGGDRSTDWIVVVDGDEVLESDPGAVHRARRILAETDALVATAWSIPMNREWPWSTLPTREQRIRHAYRAGTRVPGPAHNAYVRDGLWLNGDLAHVRLQTPVNLDLRFHHDNNARPEYRRAQAKAYRKARREQRTESWT